MDNFSNIKTFFNQYTKPQKIDFEIIELVEFTKNSKTNRRFLSNLGSISKSKFDDKSYIFSYRSKNYLFSTLSDFPLQEYDKKSLESENRKSDEVNRTLKFACSMDLINPRVVIGNSVVQIFSLVVLYQNNGIEMIMDYAHNLVMNKDDYYEIFQFQEINVVNKLELYNIYRLLKEFDFSISISLGELLLFTKELMFGFSKIEELSFLNTTYDQNGVNKYWYTIFGNYADCLFFQKEDYKGTRYEKIKEELDEFTKNPSVENKHIFYDQEKQRYRLEEKLFEYFEFSLFSDLVEEKEEKEKLLSNSRYGECHQNSWKVAYSFMDILEDYSIYIVGGKVKCNEINYVHHSWVEIEEANKVIDFNHNLIMNRDKYYKLYEAIPISKTISSAMQEFKIVTENFGISFHPLFLNYFGEEVIKDLQKNEKILLKK